MTRSPVAAVCVAMIGLSGLTGVSGCAAHRFVVPVGPATPAPDAAVAWTQATAACASTSTYRAALKLSGDLGPVHIPLLTAATVGVAVNAQDEMGLQASSSGQLIFKVAGPAALATVLLRDSHGDHVLRAPAEDIVEALVGIRLGPARLRAVLVGCVAVSRDIVRAERLGSTLRVATSDATMYLALENKQWVVRAGTFGGLTINYGKRRNGLPLKLRIDGDPAAAAPIMLALSVADAEQNGAPPASAFTVAVPAAAQPMTLAQLRAAGPLGEKD